LIEIDDYHIGRLVVANAPTGKRALIVVYAADHRAKHQAARAHVDQVIVVGIPHHLEERFATETRNKTSLDVEGSEALVR
jgi:hypothetical protein